MNSDEAQKCLNISRERFAVEDYEGAQKFAEKAARMSESRETVEWLAKVAEALNNDGDGTVRQRKSAGSSSTQASSTTNHASANSAKATNSTESASSTSSTADYSAGQLGEVKEFLKRDRNDLYGLLGVERTVGGDDLKRAYKRQALRFHPDKNRAPGADEAFKLISQAFSVLNDGQKRAAYDRYGTADSSAAAGGFSPSAAFSGGSFGGGEMSPEELFEMLFGGAFSQSAHRHRHAHHPHAQFFGPQFAFSFGPGGQFHSRAPRTRTHRGSPTSATETQAQDFIRKLLQLAPLIFVFILSFISSWLFSSPSDSSMNSEMREFNHLISLQGSSTHRYSRATRNLGVSYYASGSFQRYFDKVPVEDFTSRLSRELKAYEQVIERATLQKLQDECTRQRTELTRLLTRAKNDAKQQEHLKQSHTLPSCTKLQELGNRK